MVENLLYFNMLEYLNNPSKNEIVGSFWTSRQRQANSLHEISYRACFKPQLPNFFISLLTNENDIIFDPFAGRGTTIIEASLLNRPSIGNDINPISRIFIEPRLNPPTFEEVRERLSKIEFDYNAKADIDLSMFYYPQTESEIVSLKQYLINRKENGLEDNIDKWIRMVATNRLTGHSKGFFSVYTFPPNQAVTQEEQRKINEKKNIKPEYRDVKKIILEKTKSLLRDVTPSIRMRLFEISKKTKILTEDATNLVDIDDGVAKLTVTSPPFLDVVSYAKDNWLRFWFNNIDIKEAEKKITVLRNIDEWSSFIGKVFQELYRITVNSGYVAFEVGEVKGGKVDLAKIVRPIGEKSGFEYLFTMINKQNFTKTSHIWGIENMKKGTNSNRIVVFRK